MLIPLMVVGGSPGCDLSKDPCCDRRSSSRRGGEGVGRVRAGRVVRWWWVNEVFGFDWFEWMCLVGHGFR